MDVSEQTIYDQIERDLLGLPIAETAIEAAAMIVLLHYRIIRFRGKIMIKTREPDGQYTLMDKEAFEQAAYPLLGSMPKSHMNSAFAYLRSTAENLTANDHFIAFGATGHQVVWDMESLEIRTDILPDDCVWHSPYKLSESSEPSPLIMRLAGGDEGVYSDIMQSLAPLVMATKPVGVIWWTGDDTSGKSALLSALGQLFSSQLSHLTTEQLIGGRSNTTQLNQILGNVAEGNSQIIHSSIYKSIGSHEDFTMRKYHSQYGMEIQGGAHYIFSATDVPTVYRKDWRTHVIQLDNTQGVALPERTLGQLAAEMCRYAVQIKGRGYRYSWSEVVANNKQSEAIVSHPPSARPQFSW